MLIHQITDNAPTPHDTSDTPTIHQQPDDTTTHPQHEAPLTHAALAAAPPGRQNKMLGHKLFEAVHNHYPESAYQMVNQMLHMDNQERNSRENTIYTDPAKTTTAKRKHRHTT
eukprot:9889774-Heterocapsa_arctica.AAC.1